MSRYKGNITGYPDDEYTMPATPGLNKLFSLRSGINVDDKVESQKVRMALEDPKETWVLIKADLKTAIPS